MMFSEIIDAFWKLAVVFWLGVVTGDIIDVREQVQQCGCGK